MRLVSINLKPICLSKKNFPVEKALFNYRTMDSHYELAGSLQGWWWGGLPEEWKIEIKLGWDDDRRKVLHASSAFLGLGASSEGPWNKVYVYRLSPVGLIPDCPSLPSCSSWPWLALHSRMEVWSSMPRRIGCSQGCCCRQHTGTQQRNNRNGVFQFCWLFVAVLAVETEARDTHVKFLSRDSHLHRLVVVGNIYVTRLSTTLITIGQNDPSSVYQLPVHAA